MSNSHTHLVEAFSPPDQVTEAPDGEHEAQPRLLIVDDISDNRNILKRRFERRGFDVTEAESGLIASTRRSAVAEPSRRWLRPMKNSASPMKISRLASKSEPGG
jgi:PleD family two-component response regulator